MKYIVALTPAPMPGHTFSVVWTAEIEAENIFDAAAKAHEALKKEYDTSIPLFPIMEIRLNPEVGR